MFDNSAVNIEVLKRRAYNLRWATVENGVIPLTAADPDFRCAPEIAEAINEFVSERYLCYGPPEGLPLFRESLADFFRTKRNVPCTASHLFPVDSAAFGIYLVCRAFLKPGDEAIIFDPVDFLFRYSVESVGGVAVSFPTPPGKPDLELEKIEKLVTKKTRLICLCNPLNPTGKVFTKAELKTIGDIAVKHDLIILSDEIWSDIVFTPHTYTSMAAVNEAFRQRTVTVTGFSKSYGLAGLRIGAVIAHNEAHFNKLMDSSLHNSTIHGANVLGQVAAATAMNKCGYWLQNFVRHLQKMRDLCVKELNSINGIKCTAPEGCYVAFADITATGRSSQEIKDILLEKAKVSVVPGLKQWFGEGAEGYIRLSFATSESILTDALWRVKKTLQVI
jgi:aminotransferase